MVREPASLPLPPPHLGTHLQVDSTRHRHHHHDCRHYHLHEFSLSVAGGVQFTAGIYFMMALPIFQVNSYLNPKC